MTLEAGVDTRLEEGLVGRLDSDELEERGLAGLWEEWVVDGIHGRNADTDGDVGCQVCPSAQASCTWGERMRYVTRIFFGEEMSWSDMVFKLARHCCELRP